MNSLFLANTLCWFLVNAGGGVGGSSSDVVTLETDLRCLTRKHIAVMKYRENSKTFGRLINDSVIYGICEEEEEGQLVIRKW